MVDRAGTTVWFNVNDVKLLLLLTVAIRLLSSWSPSPLICCSKSQSWLGPFLVIHHHDHHHKQPSSRLDRCALPPPLHSQHTSHSTVSRPRRHAKPLGACCTYGPPPLIRYCVRSRWLRDREVPTYALSSSYRALRGLFPLSLPFSVPLLEDRTDSAASGRMFVYPPTHLQAAYSVLLQPSALLSLELLGGTMTPA